MTFECSVEGCHFAAATHAQALAHVRAHKRMIELTNAFEKFVKENCYPSIFKSSFVKENDKGVKLN